MRTFHVGGTATAGSQVNKMESKTASVIAYDNVKTVKRDDGSLIVMNKIGEIIVKSEEGDEKERYPAQYGATIFFKNGDEVNVGEKILEWDPFAMPVLSEVSGKIVFEDMVVGSTVKEEMDAVTGLSHKVVIESKSKEDASKQPRILVLGEDGNPVIVPGTKRQAVYRLPVGSNITVVEGSTINYGTVVAKVQRESTKTKDITGGLPRVAELFEARRPKDSAIIAENDGVIEFGKEVRGKQKISIVSNNGERSNYLITKGKHVNFNQGEKIKKGEYLLDGSPDPHDILRILGVEKLTEYFVSEVQEVYRLQGVVINDKHIETIVRQMLKRVEIKDPGDDAVNYTVKLIAPNT